MSSNDTLFVPQVTPVKSTWIQPVNDFIYKGRNPNYVTSTGTGTAYVITLPTGSLYSTPAAGDTFTFKAHTLNTGSATLTVIGSGSSGAIIMKTPGSTNLTAGNIGTDSIVTVIFDGVFWQATVLSSAAATTASGVTFQQVGTGSVVRTVQTKLQEQFSVTDFGAVGDGIADDTAAIQAAITAAEAVTSRGAIVYLPPGQYKITSNLTITWPNTTEPYAGSKAVIQGAGPELSAILDYRTSVGTGGAITIDFSSYSGTALDNHFLLDWFGGFSLVKMINNTTFNAGTGAYVLGTGVGFWAKRVPSGSYRNMYIRGYETNMSLIDCLGFTVDKCNITLADIGISAVFDVFSPPNSSLFSENITAGCRTWGIKIEGGNPTVSNSTVEVNGLMGSTSGGIYYKNDSYATTLGKGITVDSTYFESTRGAADIYIDTGAGSDVSISNTISNCSFLKVSSSFYSTNNIYCTALSASKIELLVSGNGFSHSGSYVPNASRKYIALAGTVANIRTAYISNRFVSTVEDPGVIGSTVSATRFSTPAGAYIDTSASTYLSLNGVAEVVPAGGISPVTNNTMLLGNGALRWAAIVSTNADFSGTVKWGAYTIPTPLGGTTTFLRNDGTWAVPAGGGGGVTSVTATSPVASTGGTTPVISMTAATGAVSGYVTTAAQTFGGQKTFSVSPIASLGYNIDGNTAHNNTGGFFTIIGLSGVQLYSGGGAPVSRVTAEATALRPTTDNSISCGTGSFRWTTVFAVTGTINTSDQRSKTEVAPETLGLDFIEKLTPVSYKWKVGSKEVVAQEPEVDKETGQPVIKETTTVVRAGERTFHGLIAQEVKSTLDELGVKDFAGWTLADKDDPDSEQGLRYTEFIAPLIKAVQELSARVKELEKR